MSTTKKAKSKRPRAPKAPLPDLEHLGAPPKDDPEAQARYFMGLLDTFAQRLRDSLRKSDATVRLEVGTAARLGGDEFVVLIDDFSQQPDLEVVANKILLLAAQPYHDGHHQMHVTASIGIAIYPQDAEDAAHLIKQADAAMYVAKQAGKNLFRFASA